jgi:hypothetical protein
MMKADPQAAQSIAVTPGKAIWTLLAICLAVVDAYAASGWLSLIVLLHVTWLLKLIWTDKNG